MFGVRPDGVSGCVIAISYYSIYSAAIIFRVYRFNGTMIYDVWRVRRATTAMHAASDQIKTARTTNAMIASMSFGWLSMIVFIWFEPYSSSSSSSPCLVGVTFAPCMSFAPLAAAHGQRKWSVTEKIIIIVEKRYLKGVKPPMEQMNYNEGWNIWIAFLAFPWHREIWIVMGYVCSFFAVFAAHGSSHILSSSSIRMREIIISPFYVVYEHGQIGIKRMNV